MNLLSETTAAIKATSDLVTPTKLAAQAPDYKDRPVSIKPGDEVILSCLEGPKPDSKLLGKVVYITRSQTLSNLTEVFDRAYYLCNTTSTKRLDLNEVPSIFKVRAGPAGELLLEDMQYGGYLCVNVPLGGGTINGGKLGPVADIPRSGCPSVVPYASIKWERMDNWSESCTADIRLGKSSPIVWTGQWLTNNNDGQKVYFQCEKASFADWRATYGAEFDEELKRLKQWVGKMW
ncbi:hypothetical protein H2198_001677 [Neophaeococcomyces mojaviensis]|uniref:Uncharacterized protein n=1 Tax=Neophaeococcomyces mojaviensis TaxID=3383035 RepID=A0ACC3AGY6_9EURO|nr:hypothetical protein H2198_001677 [Knufia sp. JES_112]